MTVKVTSALAGTLKVDSAEVRFVDFKSGEMEVHAAAHGDAADALGYLAATPLDAMAEHGFSSVQGAGGLRCGVDLFFPFKQFDARRVLVHVDLADATLSRRGSSVAATELAGGADIDGAQVVRADVRGRVLGGPFQMTARAPRSRAPLRTQLDFRGTLNGETLRTELGLPAAVAIGGQTEWHGVLRMTPEPARERSFHFTASLVGLELGLPAPLHKPADASLPATVDIQWPAPNVTQLRVALASIVRGDVTLNDDPSGVKLGRAAVWFGGAEPPAADAAGVTVGGDIDELDLAGWIKLASGAKPAKPLSSYLRSAQITLGRIDYLGMSFREVTLGLAADDGGWRIALDGPNASGPDRVARSGRSFGAVGPRVRAAEDSRMRRPPGRTLPGRQTPRRNPRGGGRRTRSADDPRHALPRCGALLGRPPVRRGAGHGREARGRRKPQGADGDEPELRCERHRRVARRAAAGSRES